MGDLRADIKIKMNLWGHNFKQDFWINYWDDGDGNDERVKSWFNQCYQKAMTKYYDEIDKARRKEEQKAEKDTYLRLKAKYENVKK